MRPMKKVIFEGCGVAIITPMHKDGSINYDVLARLIEFQVENGTDAIISCGTTGEASTMTQEEHKRVMKFTVDHVNHRIPVICNCGGNNTAKAIELSRYAESIGADGLLQVTPYYNKTSQAGLIRHFTAIADSVSIPSILYNVPSRTGVNIQPKTYQELSKHPLIAGCKEANGNVAAMAYTHSLCGDDLAIYSGEDDTTMAMMALGGKGVISVFANALPRPMHELCAYMLKNDVVSARKIMLEYVDLMDAFFYDVNPIPIKEAMNLMGMKAGPCRLPLIEMDESARERMIAVMKRHHLL